MQKNKSTLLLSSDKTCLAKATADRQCFDALARGNKTKCAVWWFTQVQLRHSNIEHIEQSFGDNRQKLPFHENMRQEPPLGGKFGQSLNTRNYIECSSLSSMSSKLAMRCPIKPYAKCTIRNQV